METHNLAVITKKIYDSKINLFTVRALKDLLGVKKESTLFDIIRRLLKNEILLKVERGKYLLKGAGIHDFVLANFVYQPSYVSLESALNFYGILSQFPYEIVSSTPKKTVQKIIEGKSFVYVHLKKELFWGYEKNNNFLIALPEKALLDQIYLASKGLRGLDLDEYDLSRINPQKLKEFWVKYPKTRQFIKIVEDIKKYIK
jgi:predicted transcriptional regulator of viral defense system